MKQAIINLYTIEELQNINKKVYENIINEEYDHIIEIRFNYADYDAQQLLKEKYSLNIEKSNIYYSISYSQGDGVCFIDNNILSYTRIKNKKDLNAFEKWIINNLNDNDLNMLLEYLNDGYNLNIIRNSHSYCHPWTCSIDYECFYSSDDQKYIDAINDFIYNLCTDLFNNVYVAICKDIENLLYSYYDIEEKEIKQNIIENDCYYDEEGNIHQ